ncbi:uncharacterized protein IL334_003444 [Kwoniella shivajii]|uniref:Zn(2)-C6 fungal-type domain-containing protein n=1 Tax=Kwoniella shivajii TaxID=564305 RepID=A0ABZ1CZ88_9TREE|nr:hypothetical protein IL334_003444 [Kwoniella shivajii]
MDNSPYPSGVPPDRRRPPNQHPNHPSLPRSDFDSGISNTGGRVGSSSGDHDMGRNGNGRSDLGGGEDRNFPQRSQINVSHSYQPFTGYQSPQMDLPPQTAQQSRVLPPGPPFAAYNVPQLRSAPHGYPETMQQLSSPVTAHRYEYPITHHHPNPMGGNVLAPNPSGDQAQPNYQQPTYGVNPRRRESMPEIPNKDLPNPLFSHRPIASGIGHVQNGARNGHGLHPHGHSLGNAPLSSPTQQMSSDHGHRTWQPVTAITPASATPSTPLSASSSKRSKGRNADSRLPDDNRQETNHPAARRAGAGSTITDEEGSSRPTTSETSMGLEDTNQSTVLVKDFSSCTAANASNYQRTDEAGEPDLEPKEEFDDKVDHRKRKRNRTIRSCVPCHNHKRKCDRQRPCGRCISLGLTGTCVYEIDETRDMNDPDIAENERLRRRIDELEKVVRELRQKAPVRNQISTVAVRPAAGSTSTNLETSAGEDKKRRVIVDRFARFKLDEAKDAENSAAAAGIGNNSSNPPFWAPQSTIHPKSGINRTSFSNYSPHQEMTAGPSSGSAKNDYRSEPYQTYLLPGEEMSQDKDGREVYLGASTGKSMLRRLRELAAAKGESELLSVPEDVAFTGVFPDIRKTFPFTTIWSHENFSAEITGLLPTVGQAETLWNAFEDDYAVFFHPFHVPTIHAEYSAFFSMSTSDKMNVPLSSLALYLIICGLGCVIRATTAEIFGDPDARVAQQNNPKKSSQRNTKDLTCSRLQSELYLSASQQALRLCAFLANPSMPTIQTQLLHMVYLLTSERAADCWTIGGTVVKQAIALGLHKDPLSLDPKISMRDAEIRRRLWWSIAGFDCMLCLFFGRPSTINYYSTNLPQDRPDANLADLPGSAQQYLPPSNVLSNETTEQTYHAAYYQLTIPSIELLDRIFTVDRRFSRSTIYGWFSPPPKEDQGPIRQEEETRHTYQDAVRLAHDISQWYSHLPSGVRFNENDTPEFLLGSRSRKQLNQTLILSMKTWTLVMVLHRPYLRLDPSAYPESTEICAQATHLILRTYKSMMDTKSTVSWSFWTMSYRSFQASAVCAFLAIRQPGSELADKCLTDLRGALRIFEDRLSTWNITHPVQADLCEGLVQLEKLVTAATKQRHDPQQSNVNSTHSSLTSMSPNLFGLSPNAFAADVNFATPLSQIQAFPPIPMPPPAIGIGGGNAYYPPSGGSYGNNSTNNNGPGNNHPGSQQPAYSSTNHQENVVGHLADDFNGPEPKALPQFWAHMFGIKMDKDSEPSMPSGSDSTW